MVTGIEVKTEEKTEQSTELSLEDAISSAQSETSPEIETPANEAETTEPESNADGKDRKVKPDPELEKLLKHPKVVSHLQSEKDKAVNGYRETREGDTALIRSQIAKIKELSLKQTETRMTKAMQAVLDGDEEEGLEPDKLEAKRKGFEDIKTSILEYNKNAAEVAEVAELSTTLIKTLDKGIVDEFNLNDANPTVKARGITELVAESIHFINRQEAFNKIIEEIPLLQKGSEVRTKIDSFVKEYMELPQGKSRDLLIEKLKREFSVSLKHKPTAPSGESGGDDMAGLTPEAKLVKILKQEARR